MSTSGHNVHKTASNEGETIITVGEYLARMEHVRRKYPLTVLLIQDMVTPDSLSVLPKAYTIITKVRVPLEYPLILMSRIIEDEKPLSVILPVYALRRRGRIEVKSV